MDIFRFLEELPFLSLLLAIIFLFLAAKYSRANGNRYTKMPPQPSGSWPIIGHLRLFGGAGQLLHRTLGDMADKIGPVFSIRLGSHQALVVSDKVAAKECFTTNDKAFGSRPSSLAGKIMGYGDKMFGLAPYGQYWRDTRKLATVELLSNRGLELFKHVRTMEINYLIKELHREVGKNGGEVAVEMKKKFGNLTTNIIVRMVAGKRYSGTNSNNSCGDQEESRRCQKALSDFLYLFALFLASDAVPLLGWLDWVKGYVGEMKRTARELDSILGSWVKEHREKRANGKLEEQDFIHVMLSQLDDGKVSRDETDTIIKATCLALILAGNETTMVALTWAVSLLLNNRNVLKRAQDELDTQVGRQRLVEESDIRNLVYIQAIVKETLRLYPPAPLSAPRIAVEDCTVTGFHIPAGTHLYVNLWKLHRDPSLWSNPLEFHPERFLEENAHLDVRGQDFEYLPFGSGRRVCPGVTMGLQVLQLTLAQLLHGFELGTVSDSPVDMTEGPGLTMPKATPVEVVIRPRLPSNVYEC